MLLFIVIFKISCLPLILLTFILLKYYTSRENMAKDQTSHVNAIYPEVLVFLNQQQISGHF